jgi:hypothetical protein
MADGADKISKKLMAKYLAVRESGSVKVEEFVKLGSGWHGSGYKISYRVGGRLKSAVLRTINPTGFSHDHPSDRAAVFIMQHRLFNSIPHHARSIDVGGITKDGDLISLGDAKEFFQIVEVAQGVPYFSDLERIRKEDKLKKGDIEKALALSDFLAKLHRERYKGDPSFERSLRLRHLRDALGHGEMLMGVLDTYPSKNRWVKEGTLTEVICRAIKFNRRIKELPIPLVKLHGDFHPGNIWFNGNRKFTLLDASRDMFGASADDLTALSVNYIWLSLQTCGRFEGPFKDLFDAFWGNYLVKTGDKYLEVCAPLFFAFRAVVVAHPLFYPKQSDLVRKKLITFVLNILQSEKFDPRRMNSYLEVE